MSAFASTRHSAAAIGQTGLLVLAAILSACGDDASRLVGWDVELVPTLDCTLTGQATRDCSDPAVLGQTRVTGRWIIDDDKGAPGFGGGAHAFTVTTETGITLAGLAFPNDNSFIQAVGCAGEGGTCYFARHRTDSLDPNENNCRRFTELVVIVHTLDDKTYQGLLSDVAGLDQACGTPSATELVHSVTGTRVEDPVLARAETP